MSELKSVSGSVKLPYGTLASGAEGIKNAITSFEDAYVIPSLLSPLLIQPIWSDDALTSRTSASHPNSSTPIQTRPKPCSPTPPHHTSPPPHRQTQRTSRRGSTRSRTTVHLPGKRRARRPRRRARPPRRRRRSASAGGTGGRRAWARPRRVRARGEGAWRVRSV